MTPSSPMHRTKVGATFNIPVALDLREGNGETIAAHLIQVNIGFFQLSSPVYLQSNTLIDIIFDRQRLEVEVVFCKADDRDGYAVGARLLAGINGETRREPRIPIEISARLTTSDLPGSIPARVVDISRSGLGLKVPRNIPAGVGVIVELQSGIAFGEVRHCSKKGKESWQIGLSLDEFISHRDRVKKPGPAPSESSEASSVPFLRVLKRMFGGR
jgi:hypothetical protein